MRKIIAHACSIALVSAFSFTLPTAASAAPSPTSAVGECQAFLAAYPNQTFFSNLGDCVSLVNTNGPVQICKFLDTLGGGLDNYGFENFGDCVTFFGG